MSDGQGRGDYDQASDGSVSWQEPDEQELAFVREDERLPWLESSEEERGRGIEGSRLIGFALLGLVALAVLAGAVWWFLAGPDRGGPEPDGSLIAAPAEPYKTKPADPGGRQVEGTGDASFAVGEGQTPEGRLREPSSAPSPSIAVVPPAAPDAEPQQAEPAAAPGTLVQVGAYSRREQAEEGWATLNRQTTHLSGVPHRIVRGQADIGTVYRLQATLPSSEEARRLCAALRGDGLACQVK
jgi:hypothetical protein